MRSISLALALLPAATAAEAPAEDPFCEPLRQLAQGAGETVPFQSLRESGFQSGLGSAYCSFNDAGGYTCGHSLARPDETRDNYARRIAACLPGSTRTTETDYPDRYEVVRLGKFRVRVVEHGNDRAHVGRIIDIYIDADGPAPARLSTGQAAN